MGRDRGPIAGWAKAARERLALAGAGAAVVFLSWAPTAHAAQDITVSRTSIAFGNQPVNTQSGPQTVTVSNTGDQDLHIGTNLLNTGQFTKN